MKPPPPDPASPDLGAVLQITAPSWRARIGFDVDGYADRTQGELGEFFGWTVESVEDVAKERGWKVEKRFLPIPD